MTARKGLYSIIQYCPDISRLEVANIGVLLFVPEDHFFEAKMSRSNNRARKVFGKGSFDNSWLKRTKAMFAERVKAEAASSLDEFKHFIDTRMNDIILTAPRPVRVYEADRTLADLFEAIVEIESPRRKETADTRRSPAFVKLENAFEREPFRGKIERDRRIPIPALHKDLNAPFAYQNGKLNLIIPRSFKSASAVSQGSELSVKANYLKRVNIAESTIIPECEDEQAAEIVLAIFETERIEFVLPEQLEAFVHKVAQEIHR